MQLAPKQQRLTCALKSARLLPQRFSSESTGNVYIKFFMYVGFSLETTAMFGQKQTLLLHLFTGINNVLLSCGWALCMTSWALLVTPMAQCTYLLGVTGGKNLPETCGPAGQDCSSLCMSGLTATYNDRWIGQGGPVAWPPQSPDLTLMDFFL